MNDSESKATHFTWEMAAGRSLINAELFCIYCHKAFLKIPFLDTTF